MVCRGLTASALTGRLIERMLLRPSVGLALLLLVQAVVHFAPSSHGRVDLAGSLAAAVWMWLFAAYSDFFLLPIQARPLHGHRTLHQVSGQHARHQTDLQAACSLGHLTLVLLW